MTLQRLASFAKYKEYVGNKKLAYYALRSLQYAGMLGEVLSMYRRMMIGCMQDPLIQIVTIVVTGVEEALLVGVGRREIGAPVRELLSLTWLIACPSALDSGTA